jgi:hypothetical protein
MDTIVRISIGIKHDSKFITVELPLDILVTSFIFHKETDMNFDKFSFYFCLLS